MTHKSLPKPMDNRIWCKQNTDVNEELTQKQKL